MYQRNGINNYVGMFDTEESAFLATVSHMREAEIYITRKLLDLEEELINEKRV